VSKNSENCAVFKIDAFVSVIQQNKILKMTAFGWFFLAAILNLAFQFLPAFPAREKCGKKSQFFSKILKKSIKKSKCRNKQIRH